MKKAQKGTAKKVLQYLRPYRALVAASILLSAAAVAGTLYIPVLVGRAIDRIIGPGQVDLEAVGKLLTTIGIIAGATAGIQWLNNTINNRITYQVIRDVRSRAFRRLQVLPLSYLDAHPTGEIVSRVIADVDQFADGLLLGFSQLFTGAATILGTLGFMLAIRPGIAAVVVLLTPLSFVVAKFIAGHTYRFFSDQSEARGAQTAFIDEMLGNQKVVRAFGREEKSREAFDGINERLAECSLKAVFFSSLTNPCTRFVNNVVYAAVALTGALVCLGSGGAFTVGSLSALLSYANQYTKPFNEISGVVTELQNALACAERIFDLIAEPAEEPDAPDARVLKDVAGHVTIDGVAFSYVPERPLITGLSLDVPPGSRVAIVGPTGCGKTTLINLLMRFYDVQAGAIRAEGTDIRRITRRSLRGAYGMVLQDTWLRTGTIRENLTLGKPDATDEEVLAACKAAHAHSFIRRLPQGYDTVIGEDGGQLSQGQKQLLCIARIMLRLPPMLILDEATSSIDTRTEAKIQQAFTAMMEGRTTFIVAHRLSTIREADVILAMRDGRIVEQGSHEELLKKDGFYANLYNSQFAS
ncbi:MAG: ABC transporter ATP-binding protein [Clostridia bacterium]|nr:ABC transporter ATP-binding protein [Clostridia bacterium]